MTMSNVNLRCASLGCRQILTVPAGMRGQQVTCKFCKRVMRVPGGTGGAGTPAESVPVQPTAG
jgi:hypothetical protein